MTQPNTDNPKPPPGPTGQQVTEQSYCPAPEAQAAEPKGARSMATTEKQISDEVAAVKEDMKQLREDMKELASLYKQAASERATRTGQRISEGYHDKADAVRERLEDMRDQTSRGAHRAEEFVEERPFTTALAALAFGLITGAMLGHRK